MHNGSEECLGPGPRGREVGAEVPEALGFEPCSGLFQSFTFELRKVSPVLPGDVLAKFLHGSANYFLSSSKL